jgi:mono/diheme cytochrome c family protein
MLSPGFRMACEIVKTKRFAMPTSRILLMRGLGLACLGVLAGCALLPKTVVSVEPDPMQFGRDNPGDFAAAGRKLAQQHCSSCHAIGPERVSPVRAAPAFSGLLAKHDPDALTNRLINGISVTHGNMPGFDFNVIAADSLVAYIETIQVGR